MISIFQIQTANITGRRIAVNEETLLEEAAISGQILENTSPFLATCLAFGACVAV
jgi:hypothetical protein